jgi:hypothetical protein
VARRSISEIEAQNPAAAQSAAVLPRSFPIVAKGTLMTASWYTGLTVSMIRTLVRDGTIPAQWQGDRIIILREDLDFYMVRSKRLKRYEPRKHD